MHHHYVTFLGAESLTESSSEPGVAIKQEPQEEDLAKPPRAPRTLSSFFSEFVPPSPPRGCAGRRQGGFLRRKLQIPPVFPRVGKSNSCLLACHPLRGNGAVLGGEGCGVGDRTHNFLASFPAPRKPAIKKEVKEEESVTPRKEEPKG